MKTTRTFKANAERTTVFDWVAGSINELTADAAPTLGKTIRITVELVKAADLAIDPILDRFEVTDAKAAVVRFIEWRIDERRAPLTLKGLVDAIKPFAGRPRELIAAIGESMRYGWRGLFEPKDRNVATRDFVKVADGPKGGAW